MKKTLILIAAMSLLGSIHANNSNHCDKQPVGNVFVMQGPSLDGDKLQYVDFSQVASQTIDAVVHIKTELVKSTPLYESFFGFLLDRGTQQKTYTAFGSGVIISSDGYIITNNHVVQDATTISVTLNDKRELTAELIGTDPATDLALVKIKAEDLQYIPFGNSDAAKIGQPVLAIGNPFNLTSTVTSGIISAKARNVNIIDNPDGFDSPIESFIQTDAAVNSGNSGGALVNGDAQLIGVVTAIASGNGFYTGYSFAIPSNLALKVANDLRKYGYVQRAYLGISVAELNGDIAKEKGLTAMNGVYIGEVFPNCAAEKAGIQEGDILLSVNNSLINTYAEMMEEVGKFNPGDKVEVSYWRNGKKLTTSLTLLNSQGTTEVLTKAQMEAERQRQIQEHQRQQQEHQEQLREQYQQQIRDFFSW